jgi:hypothetical protein
MTKKIEIQLPENEVIKLQDKFSQALNKDVSVSETIELCVKALICKVEQDGFDFNKDILASII